VTVDATEYTRAVAAIAGSPAPFHGCSRVAAEFSARKLNA